MFPTEAQRKKLKPGGTTTRMVGRPPITTRMVDRRLKKPEIQNRLQVKVGQAPIRPQQLVPFKPGAGKAFDPESIKLRHRQFLRQQRENKIKVRSIVRRSKQTGFQRRIKGVVFKRGVVVASTRLKQFAEFSEMEVIREMPVTSSWVSTIHLVKYQNQPALAITFHSGFTALYPTTNIRDYEAMSRSASKGKYIWASLYHGVPGAGAPYITFP